MHDGQQSAFGHPGRAGDEAAAGRGVPPHERADPGRDRRGRGRRARRDRLPRPRPRLPRPDHRRRPAAGGAGLGRDAAPADLGDGRRPGDAQHAAHRLDPVGGDPDGRRAAGAGDRRGRGSLRLAGDRAVRAADGPRRAVGRPQVADRVLPGLRRGADRPAGREREAGAGRGEALRRAGRPGRGRTPVLGVARDRRAGRLRAGVGADRRPLDARSGLDVVAQRVEPAHGRDPGGVHAVPS